MKTYIITVRLKGISGAEGLAYKEEYTGTPLDAERRASHIWNAPYASSPDRYYLTMREERGGQILRIN